MSKLGVTKERCFCCIDCASSCSPKLFSFDLYWILTFVCFGNAFWHGLLLCPLLRLNWQCILWLVFISFHFRFCFLIWLLSVNYDIVYLYMIVFIQMFVCMCMFVYVWIFMFVCLFVGCTHARPALGAGVDSDDGNRLGVATRRERRVTWRRDYVDRWVAAHHLIGHRRQQAVSGEMGHGEHDMLDSVRRWTREGMGGEGRKGFCEMISNIIACPGRSV